MRLKSTSHIPPGGWYFVERGITLTEASFAILVTRLTQHRKSNNYPPGNPIQEIHEAICARAPSYCYGGSKGNVRLSYTVMAKKFLSAVAKLSKQSWQLVSQEEADRRGSICLTCPMNEDATITRGGCGTCRKAAARILGEASKRLLNGKGTAHDTGLKSCMVCGCDNKLQIWFPSAALNVTTAEAQEYPWPCWKKLT